VDEPDQTRVKRLGITAAAMIVLVVFGISRGVPPFAMILIGVAVGLMVVRLSPGLAGHHARLWTLKDGTFMTGCGCGWAGTPRSDRQDAEADIEHHRIDPSAPAGGGEP
jgi:hypothetical protein